MESTTTPPAPQSKQARRFKSLRSVLLFIGSIIMPLGALGVEIVSGMCGSIFFDPIPSSVHVLLIAMVPLVHFLCWQRLRKGKPFTSLQAFVIGGALATSAFYAVLFVPLMPLAVIYTAYSFAALFLPALLTLLPFAPLASLLAGLANLARARKQHLLPARSIGIITAGALVVLLSLVALEAPRVIARVGSERLAKEPQAEGVLTLMRLLADRGTLLKASYSGVEWVTDFVQWLTSAERGVFGRGSRQASSVSIEQSREIYFRVTGEHFTTKERPTPRRTGWFSDLDFDQGGAAVGGLVPSVQLASSALDGSIDAKGALAYMEWTLAFTNNSSRNHEARFEILLPEGSVVSRATLWIDGEEQEAAIGGRAEVRAAYQKIVQAQRDPLLVTSAAPGRILVQCFPVSSKAGPMKIKIGVTAPLKLQSLGAGSITLPVIVARNFSIPDSLRSSVWLESKGAMTGPSDLSSEKGDGAFALRGSLALAREDSQVVKIHVAREARARHAWAKDSGNSEVFQELREEERQPIRRIALVLDGSLEVEANRAALAEAIRHLPTGIELGVFVAADGSRHYEDRLTLTSEATLEQYARRVFEESFSGGVDNVPALAAAWDSAAKGERSLIVWVHGNQPIPFPSISQLAQRYARRPQGTRIVSLSLRPGVNRIAEAPELQRYITESDALWGDPSGLAPFISDLTSKHVTPVVSRARVSCSPQSCQREQQTSDHLVRLFALSEIEERLASGKRAEAVALAIQYRLVTSASGAVVLERVSDYAKEGLTAPPEASGKVAIPGVPEPEEWILVLVSFIAVLRFLVTQRRSAVNL